MYQGRPHAPTAVRLGTLVALAAIVHVTPAAAQTERFSLEGDRVGIYNLAGRVSIEGGSGHDVRVEVRRGGADARRLNIATGRVGGREALRVVYPTDRIVYPELRRGTRTTVTVDDDGTFGDGNDRGSMFGRRGRVEIRDSGSGLEAFADMSISVPRGKRVELHLAAGDVRIANVDGDLFVDVNTAEVTSEHTRGALSLDTGAGAVRVTDAQGDVNLDTGSGGVTIDGVRGTSLRMDTGSGSIRGGNIDVRDLVADVGSGGIHLARVRAERVNLDTGSGGTELELLSDVDQLIVDAGSGGVTLRVPENIGAEIEVETGSGSIDTDLPVRVRKFERRYLAGTVGDGRGRIKIDSGSGSVRILKN